MEPECNPFQKFFWNQANLKPPKSEYFETSTKTNIQVKNAIRNEFSANAIRDLLFLEMATLSKLMVRLGKKYRSERGFNTIGKIKKAANRLCDLKISSTTELIKLNLTRTFVPSKQLCQWFLVKLQSAGQLLHRITECSCYSFITLKHRLQTGHSWVEVMTAMAMISRIWSLATFLFNKCCRTYKILISIVDDLLLNFNDSEWLPSNYVFPDDLQNWITETKNSQLLFNVATTSTFPSTEYTKGKNSVTKAIKTVRNSKTLKIFFFHEQKRRAKNHAKCISQNLDALQWHMLEKKVHIWIKQLRKADESDILLRKIRKQLRNLFL